NPGPTGQDAASVREPRLAGGRRVRLAGAVLIPESPHPHLPRFPSGTPISSGAYIQTATDWQAAMAAEVSCLALIRRMVLQPNRRIPYSNNRIVARSVLRRLLATLVFLSIQSAVPITWSVRLALN